MKNTIKTVVVGTEDVLQIKAVTNVFEGFHPEIAIVSCDAKSGVDFQSIGTLIVRNAARGRAGHAKKLHPDADLYIGIENGVDYQNGSWFNSTCVFIATGDGSEDSVAFGAYFPIPQLMGERSVYHEIELGEIVSELTDGEEKDPVKYLSGGFVLREQLLSQAVQCALTPILFSHRYRE